MGTDIAAAMLKELEPTAEKLLGRHLERTKEWFPHQITPWSKGSDFEPDYEWSPADFELSDAVRSALFVNVLTEEGLPFYFRDSERLFGKDGPLGEWVRRWTAEEARHGRVMYDYLTITRALDPIELERARMASIQSPQVPEPQSPLDGLAYVSFQELATRISHFNTGEMLHDSTGKDIMRRIAADENLHFLFYRDMTSAALEMFPSQATEAISRQVIQFEMPGRGMPGFAAHAAKIARSGIYDMAVHCDKIITPLIEREWKIAHLEGLSSEADHAREDLFKHIGRLRKVADRIEARRSEKV